jgi:hypothetical protein
VECWIGNEKYIETCRHTFYCIENGKAMYGMRIVIYCGYLTGGIKTVQ